MVHLIDLEEAAQAIRQGKIGAFPTETVYGLGAHPFHTQALRRIFSLKGRTGEQPLSLHIGQLPDLFKFAQDLPGAAGLLIDRFWPGPLTLIVPASPLVPAEARSDKRTVAFRYPSNETCQRFLRYVGGPVAATSANKSGSLSPLASLDVEEEIGGEIDFLLDDASLMRVESTLVDLTQVPFCILRQGAISKERLETESGLHFDLQGPILQPLSIWLVRGEPNLRSRWCERELLPLNDEAAILSRKRPVPSGKIEWVPLPEAGQALFLELARLQRAGRARLIVEDIWPETSSIRRRLALRTTRMIDLEKGEGECM